MSDPDNIQAHRLTGWKMESQTGMMKLMMMENSMEFPQMAMMRQMMTDY